MDTNDTPKPSTSPEDDPRSPENTERRRRLGIAERDVLGRLLPGSVLPGAGRKPDALNIMALARAHTERAIQVLREVVDDPKAPQAARVAASQALLDRGWGKAPIQVDVVQKARFDDFLRDVGLAATYEMEHPALLPAVIDEGLADESPTSDEDDDAPPVSA